MSIEDKDLEPTVSRVLQHIDGGIMEEGIEGCHRLMRKKSELRKLKPSELDLPNGTKLYINESLCPYYRGLWNQCKKLWNQQISFFIANGSVRIKIREGGPYNIITHIDNLKYIFPDEDFTMS